MAMLESGGNKVTRASRTYKRGSVKIDVGAVTGGEPGPAAGDAELGEERDPRPAHERIAVDGFTVLRTFATQGNVSTIVVALSSNAAFSLVSRGIPEDEAFHS